LEEAVKYIQEFCKMEEDNVGKIVITVLKKGGKLSKNEKLRLGTEEIQATNNIKYLGLILDGGGEQ
jgi:hypothetical protein